MVHQLEPIGRSLIFFGVIIIVIGGLMTFAGKVPWFGRLPGDILLQRDNFTFYFPLTTMILISLLLTLLFNLVGRH